MFAGATSNVSEILEFGIQSNVRKIGRSYRRGGGADRLAVIKEFIFNHIKGEEAGAIFYAQFAL